MVRLKVPRYYRKRLVQLFQFLMVRLKVLGADRIIANYGISIPYGSIKSRQGGRTGAEPRPFQFLMVRLKGRAL